MVKLEYFNAGQLSADDLNRLVTAIKELQDIHRFLLNQPKEIALHMKNHLPIEHSRFDTILEELE